MNGYKAVAKGFLLGRVLTNILQLKLLGRRGVLEQLGGKRFSVSQAFHFGHISEQCPLHNQNCGGKA